MQIRTIGNFWHKGKFFSTGTIHDVLVHEAEHFIESGLAELHQKIEEKAEKWLKDKTSSPDASDSLEKPPVIKNGGSTDTK